MSALNLFMKGSSDDALVKALGIEEQKQIGPFTLATCYAVVFANNMKHIHLHIQGKKFDNIHSITEEYYEQASEDSDYLAELCIEKVIMFRTSVKLPSLSRLLQLLPCQNMTTKLLLLIWQFIWEHMFQLSRLLEKQSQMMIFSPNWMI